MQNVHFEEIKLSSISEITPSQPSCFQTQADSPSSIDIEMAQLGLQQIETAVSEKPEKPANQQEKLKNINFLDEVNQSYSAESSENLLDTFAEAMDTQVADIFEVAGPWLGVGMWVFLKMCHEPLRKQVLSSLSQIRNTVKSMRTVEQTMQISGAFNRLPVATGGAIGSTLGLMTAAFMTFKVVPEIKIIEERIQRNIKLNNLLKKHLETSVLIPEGLSELQLLLWLEDPTQFAELPRRQMRSSDLTYLDPAEAEKLVHLKVLAEIINGVYSLSVLDSDLSFSGLGKCFLNPTSLILNTAVGAAMVATSYQIARHQTEGLLLKSEQVELSAKLELKQTLPESSSTPKETLQKQLSVCERKIQDHRKVNFNRVQLANAGLKGFLEGAETVTLLTGIPIWLLVVTHVVSAAFPPLYFTVLALTLVAGVYVSSRRYQQKKLELEKQEAGKIEALPVSKEIELQPLSIYEKPAISGQRELTPEKSLSFVKAKSAGKNSSIEMTAFSNRF